MITAVKIYGVPEALRAFDELPRRVRFKHLRIALNAAGGVIRNAAQGIVRRETGLLARSLKVKVTIPDASFNKKHHGKPSYAVIGPARRVSGMVQMHAGKLRVRTLKQLQKVGFRGNLIRLFKTNIVDKAGNKQTIISNKRRPSRYAHLVERGHQRGRGKSAAPAYSFLSSAVASSGTAALVKATDKLQQGIIAEATLLRAAGARNAVLTT